MRTSQYSRSAGGSIGKYTHSPYSLSSSNNEAQNDEMQSRSEQNSQSRTELSSSTNNKNKINNEERQCEMSEPSRNDRISDDDKLVDVHDKLSIPSTPLNLAVENSIGSQQRNNSSSSGSNDNNNNNNNNSKKLSSNTRRNEINTSEAHMYNCDTKANNNNETCTPFSMTTASSSSAHCNFNYNNNNNNNNMETNFVTDSNSMETSTPTTVLASELSSSSLSLPINAHPTINVQPRHGRLSHGMTRWNTTLNGLPLSPSSKVYLKSNSYYSSCSSSSSPTYNINNNNKNSVNNNSSSSTKYVRRENNSQTTENVSEALNRENINRSVDNQPLSSSDGVEQQEQQLEKQQRQEESDQTGSTSCSPSSMNYFQSLPAENVEHENDALPSYHSNLSCNTSLSHKVHPVPHTYAPARFMAKNKLTLANESSPNAWMSANHHHNNNNTNVNEMNNKNYSSNLEDSNTNMEKSTSTLGSPFNRSYNESAQLSYNTGYNPLRHKSLSITNNSMNFNNNNNNSFSHYSSTPAQTVDLPLSVNVKYNHAMSTELPSSSSSYSPPYRTNYHNTNRSFSNNNNNYNFNNSTDRNSYNSNSNAQPSPQSYQHYTPGHYSPLSNSQSNTQLTEPTHSPTSSFVSSHFTQQQQQQQQQQQYNNSPPSAEIATSYSVSHGHEAKLANTPSYLESTTQSFLTNGVNNETNNQTYGFDVNTNEMANNNNNNNNVNSNFGNGSTSNSSAVIHATANTNTPFVATTTNTNNNGNNNFSSSYYNSLPGQTNNFSGWDMNAQRSTSTSSPLSHKLITPPTLHSYSSASAPRFNPHPMNNNNINNNNSSNSYNSQSYRSNPRRHRSFSLNNNNINSSFHKSGLAIMTNNIISSNNNEDTLSVSSKSCSNASSVRDNLELCPKDEECPLINDRRHQRQFAHTCRLFPCYHGHIIRHAKLFRHTEGQIAEQEGIPNGKISAHALTSVNFSSISPEAPNAYRIYVSHGEKSYEIFGDWASVRVHTFKRYLHQVCHVRPEAQVLIMVATNTIMDDEISSVKEYGVEADCEIQLKLDIELDEPGLLLDEL